MKGYRIFFITMLFIVLLASITSFDDAARTLGIALVLFYDPHELSGIQIAEQRAFKTQ